MQSKMWSIISEIGVKALSKSQRYYYPCEVSALDGEEGMSDDEFAAMLRDIDAFSVQFAPPAASAGKL